MKRVFFILLGFAFVSPFFTVNAVQNVSAVDAGGQRATSADYAMDSSLGGIVGVSTSAPPAEVARHGFVGQLAEAQTVTGTGSPSAVPEGGTSQLSGVALMDDGTATLLAADEIVWSGVTFPLAGIDADGLATALTVYADTVATFTCSGLGVAGSGSLLVLDSLPDNCGFYAGDGVPDGWQVQYFGPLDPLGLAEADADGDGLKNWQEYVAGTDPTNPASLFVMARPESAFGTNYTEVVRFVAATNFVSDGEPYSLPDRWMTQRVYEVIGRLLTWPGAAGRVYDVEYRTNLFSGEWSGLAGASGLPGTAPVNTVTDTVPACVKFYRVKVRLP